MTNLLTTRDGQAENITIEQWNPFFVCISDAHVGNWYSPAAVARMIEEARREERERCAKLCDYLQESWYLAGDCAIEIRKRGEK